MKKLVYVNEFHILLAATIMHAPSLEQAAVGTVAHGHGVTCRYQGGNPVLQNLGMHIVICLAVH